jgi:hemerythrin
MALINWHSNYIVNIKKIDKQHQQLVNIINELHDGMKTGKGKEILSNILDELIKYTAFHFKYEEMLFDKYVYPETKIHKRQHSDLVEKVLAYKENYNNGKKVLTMEVMDFLKEWLTRHIVGSDKNYSSFLNSKGVV